MQLHDVLAMKTWFKLILYVKGYEKSKDTTFYYLWKFYNIFIINRDMEI